MTNLSEKMLLDLCSWLSGQDSQLEKEAIPILSIHYGYAPEDFESAGICTAEEAKGYIEEYRECL